MNIWDDPIFSANVKSFDKLLSRLESGEIIKTISQPSNSGRMFSEYWLEDSTLDLSHAKNDLGIIIEAAKKAGALISSDLNTSSKGYARHAQGYADLSNESLKFDIDFKNANLKKLFDEISATLGENKSVARSKPWMNSVGVDNRSTSFEKIWKNEQISR